MELSARKFSHVPHSQYETVTQCFKLIQIHNLILSELLVLWEPLFTTQKTSHLEPPLLLITGKWKCISLGPQHQSLECNQLPKPRHLRALQDILGYLDKVRPQPYRRNTLQSNRRDTLYTQNEPMNMELNPKTILVPPNSTIIPTKHPCKPDHLRELLWFKLSDFTSAKFKETSL